MNHDLVQQYEMYPRHIHDFTTQQGQVNKNIVMSHVNAPQKQTTTTTIKKHVCSRCRFGVLTS